MGPHLFRRGNYDRRAGPEVGSFQLQSGPTLSGRETWVMVVAGDQGDQLQ